MAWGTPTSRGTATDTDAPTSLPIASVTVAAGSLILVAGAVNLNTPTITVTDRASNTYTVIQSNNTQPNPDQVAFLAYARAATELDTGTVTVAWGGGSISSALAEVFEVTGGIFIDSAVTATGIDTSNTTSPTLTSGTPSQTGDLLIAVDVTNSTSSTWTEDTANDWDTARGKDLSVANDNAALAVSYKVNAGVGTTTWAPTTANNNHAKIIAGFLANPEGSAAQTLADVTQAAVGMLTQLGVAAQTLDDVTQVATGIQRPRRAGPGALDLAMRANRSRYRSFIRPY